MYATLAVRGSQALFARSYAVGQNLLEGQANLKGVDGKDLPLTDLFKGKKVHPPSFLILNPPLKILGALPRIVQSGCGVRSPRRLHPRLHQQARSWLRRLSRQVQGQGR